MSKKRGPIPGPGFRQIAVREASNDLERKALNWFDGQAGDTEGRLARVVSAYLIIQNQLAKEQTPND